jgi:hypothetical protein
VIQLKIFAIQQPNRSNHMLSEGVREQESQLVIKNNHHVYNAHNDASPWQRLSTLRLAQQQHSFPLFSASLLAGFFASAH